MIAAALGVKTEVFREAFGGVTPAKNGKPSEAEAINRVITLAEVVDTPILIVHVSTVDGVAAAGGLGIALSCDLVIATQRSRFAQLFIHRGLSLDSGASWLLPCNLSTSAAGLPATVCKICPAALACGAGTAMPFCAKWRINSR